MCHAKDARRKMVNIYVVYEKYLIPGASVQILEE